MSILSSIKEERKLSFNHWRYRILHWAFNVHDPDPRHPEDTGLPRFLYTHYCPLFHLTNLIAILSPLILFVKLVVIFFKAIGGCFMWLAERIDLTWLNNYLSKLIKAAWPKDVAKPAPRVHTKDDDRKMFVSNLPSWVGSFDSYWDYISRSTVVMTREEAEALYNEYYTRIEEAREKARLRKEKFREYLIFWTNFSRVFIKWTLNVFYAALAVTALYLAYLAVGPVWSGLCWFGHFVAWLFTDAVSLDFVLFLGKVFLYLGILTVVMWGLLRVGLVQRFLALLYVGLVKVSAPLYIFVIFGRWVKNGFAAASEFVSMFYEENCPPITLVTEEEAVVEAVARGEEETVQ